MLTILVLALGLIASVANADFTFDTPTNLGPTVNSAYAELSPFISVDGLQLYFGDWPVHRPGGYGGNDIRVHYVRCKISSFRGGEFMQY